MAHYKGAATEANRAMHIMKKRERAKEELELKKQKIEQDLKLSTIDNKFATHHDSIETQLRSSTVGLVTLEQMRQRQETAERERKKQIAHKEEDRTSVIQQKQGSSKSVDKSIKKKKLSYDNDDDEDDDSEGDITTDKDRVKPDEIGKEDNLKDGQRDIDDEYLTAKKKTKLSRSVLDVDTSLLPDREREEEERLLREKLAAEWHERQRKLKEEDIEITFSYWDGSGHRRFVRMKKGNSIYQFLQACLETLRKDFNELRSVSADQLMYVKEDLIIPHHYTFYDFIVTKARGKSGPLFSFDVHEDVRLIADATVEKDESHAGKVLLRSWYERNKHIFPASRWEPYDPTKTYEKYTISDKQSK